MKRSVARALRAISIGILASAALCACAPLIMGGVMVGGALVATDRRTSGAMIEDENIELRAASRIGEVLGDRGAVAVTSYNRVVLLTGDVPTAEDKAKVERAVGGVENVKSVVDELVVGFSQSLISRSRDALITTKVKSSFIDARDLFSNSFKVVTSHDTVYLMGRVTEREAARATDIARGVEGVQKVVRVFELISEAELAHAVAKTPATAASAASAAKP